MSEIIYLAVPFGHKDPTIQQWRLKVFESVDLFFFEQGVSIISPMHMIDYALRRGLPVTWDYWETHGETLLQQSDKLYVICLPEWRHSKGVFGEIELARKYKKEIVYLYEPWLRHNIINYFNPYGILQEGKIVQDPDFKDMY